MNLLTLQDLQPLKNTAKGQKIFTLERYFKPIQKILYRKRLQMVLDLLGNRKYEQILDIGFGSGIFIPELAARCEKLTATEIHEYIPVVQEIISLKNISADLLKADICQMPFANNTFDCIVCLSVLEFIPNISQAITEIKRVAKPGAKIIVGAPVLNCITDMCYKAISYKKHADSMHKTNHQQIITEMRKLLQIKKIKRFPAFLPFNLALFFAIEAEK